MSTAATPLFQQAGEPGGSFPFQSVRSKEHASVGEFLAPASLERKNPQAYFPAYEIRFADKGKSSFSSSAFLRFAGEAAKADHAASTVFAGLSL
jgi:hypothetical protein